VKEKNKNMRSKLDTITKLAAGVVLTGVALLAGPSSSPRNIADEVRHKILTVPNITVFDNLAYEVDNGVVTLSGEVTRPIEKDYVEKAVKNVEGVTSVNDQIEVLPLSPFDDQIRFRTLRTLLHSPSLNKYFMGTQPSIRIIVKNGHVTLDGVVLNSGDREIAYISANGIPGVFSVTNNLHTEK
jgi:hyperosmotically inducible protein